MNTKRRRWWTFSLLSLFGAATVAAIICALALQRLRAHRDQLETAAQVAGVDVSKLNRIRSPGSFTIWEGGRQTGYIVDTPGGWPSDVARGLNRPYDMDVVGIILANHDHNGLEAALKLPRLRKMVFSEARITAKVLRTLARFHHLDELKLANTNVTKEQIADLKSHLLNTSIIVTRATYPNGVKTWETVNFDD